MVAESSDVLGQAAAAASAPGDASLQDAHPSTAKPPSTGVLAAGGQPIKPRCDRLEYRFLELTNNLRVLLVHDAETDKAAVALNVRSPLCPLP